MNRLVSKLWRGRKSLVEAALRLVGAALQILSAMIVARMLPIAEAGVFFVGFTLVTVVSVLCRAGSDQALSRFVAGDLALGNTASALFASKLLWRRYGIRSVVVTGLMVALWFIGGRWSGMNSSLTTFAMLPFIIAIPFFGFAFLAGVGLQAGLRSGQSVAVTFGFSNLAVIACASIPALQASALPVALAFLGGCVSGAAIGLAALRRMFRQHASTASRAAFASERTREVIIQTTRENGWAVVGNLALMWGPLALIGLLAAAQDAASYGVASRAAQIVAFILPALNFVLAPRFAILQAARRYQELQHLLRSSVALAAVASSLVALPLLLGSKWVVGLAGPGYDDSVVVFSLLVVAQWISAAAGPVIQFLAMTGKEVALRTILLGSGVVTLAVGVVLVDRYGATGAALTSLCGFVLTSLLCMNVAFREARKLCVEPESESESADSGLTPSARI